jgi:hypothetical protein
MATVLRAVAMAVGVVVMLVNWSSDVRQSAAAPPREPGPKGVTLASKGSASQVDREQLVGTPSPPASVVKPHTAPPTIAPVAAPRPPPAIAPMPAPTPAPTNPLPTSSA